MITVNIIDTILELVIETGTHLAFDKLVETEPGRMILSKLGISRELAPNDFESIYKRALLEYSVNCYRDQQSKKIIRVFADPGLQRAFEQSFRLQNPAEFQSCLNQLYEASTVTGELDGIDRPILEKELHNLIDIFDRIVGDLRPLYLDPLQHEIRADHKAILAELADLKAQIISSQTTSALVHQDSTNEVRSNPSPEVAYLRQMTVVEESIATNPANAEAWLEKASLLYNANDLDNALKAINRASELDDGKSIDILHGRACILCDYARDNCNSPKSFLAEALEIFQTIRSAVGEAIADYHIGNALSGLGRHEEAISSFQQAIATLKDVELKARAWTNMGNSYVSIGDGKKAIDSFQHALELDPSKWQAFLSWGEYELKKNNNFEFAAKLYWNAFYINPSLAENDANAAYDVAYCFWNLGAYEDAFIYTNKVLINDPEHENAKLLKAHLLIDLWRKNETHIYDAIKFFEAWLVDNPHNAFALHVLHVIYDSEGYKERARLIIERNVNPEILPAFACYDYAMFLKSEGNLKEAIRWLELAVKQSHEHHYVHEFARLQFKVGNYQTALKYYRLAIIDCSNPENVLDSIADCYHLLKDYQNCLVTTMKLLLIEPQNTRWWGNLSYALLQIGKRSLLPSRRFLSRLEDNDNPEKFECEQQIASMLDKLEANFGTEFVNLIKSDRLPEN